VPDRMTAVAERAGLCVGRDVVFLSDVGPELVSLYDDAAAFLSLSWRESFGMPALEAAARGVPVVVSGWGAAREVLGDAATYVDPTDIVAAAGALVTAIAVNASRRRRPNLEMFSRFSWKRTAGAVLDVSSALTHAGRKDREYRTPRNIEGPG
jgi:glycosyltransferase involved in cell wall biosynthesis